MKQINTTETYQGFDFPAYQISSFLYARSFNTFIISVKDMEGTILFRPEKEEDFYDWLHQNHIREYIP